MFSGTISGAAGRPVAYDVHPAERRGSSPAVLILHGFKGFKDWGFFPWLAERLAEQGLTAVRINASHAGVGLGSDATEFTRLDLFRRNRPSYELRDLRAVRAALARGELAGGARVPLERIGFLGHSRGGPIAMLAAADSSTAPVVTWASVPTLVWGEAAAAAFEADGVLRVPNARTGQIMELDRTAYDDVVPLPAELDLAPCLPRIGERLLLVHGEDDPTVPVAAAMKLRDAASGRAHVLRVPGADHVFGARHPFTGPTPALERALAATAEHFREAFFA
ncbi:MAG: prolyl oligopeptidase family serine peptidase [Planctomycetota bacterium]